MTDGRCFQSLPVTSFNTEQRKLAVIMLIAMVGFSALSQRNEALALQPRRKPGRKLRKADGRCAWFFYWVG
jgi:hypothetical protein